MPTKATKALPWLRHSLLSLFAAGAISVLVFHQGAVTILHALEWTDAPFAVDATKPLGVPKIWSQAFWGGVWGIVFGAFERRFPGGPWFWVWAILFGAILLPLVGWFIVAPIKGLPIAAGGAPSLIAVGLVINGAWGLGMGLLLRWRP